MRSKMIRTMMIILCLLAGTIGAGASGRGQLLDRKGEALEMQAYAGLTTLVEDHLTSGNNVATTIDAGLQRAAQNALTKALGTKMPGTVVVMDGQGRVLALADNQREKQIPLALTVRATPGRTLTPVTTLAAFETLELFPNEIISDQGRFMLYSNNLATAPKCWISSDQIYMHQHQTSVQGLANSCDYFFYTLGSRVGPEGMAQMGKDLGLDSLSGLGIPGEITGILACQKALFDPDLPLDEQLTDVPAEVRATLIEHLGEAVIQEGRSASEETITQCADALMRMAADNNPSDWVVLIRDISRQQLSLSRDALLISDFITPIYNQLEQIKWYGNQTAEAAMGRSFTRVTPIAMARYWAALMNGGRVMDARLVESVTGANGEKIFEAGASKPIRDLTGEIGAYIEHVKKGLEGVVDVTGKAVKAFPNDSRRKMAREMSSVLSTKESEDPEITDGTWMTGMFPYENPQISVVVFLAGSGENEAAANIFCEVIEQYLAQSGT